MFLYYDQKYISKKTHIWMISTFFMQFFLNKKHKPKYGCIIE